MNDSQGEGLLEGTHTILTPEYVEFQFPLAGLMSRFWAWAIDTIVVLMLATVLIFVLFQLAIALAIIGGDSGVGGFIAAAGFVLWFFLDWGYMIVCETIWSGQSIGKRLLQLRVIQVNGVRVGFWQVALRNLVRPLDRAPWLWPLGPGYYLLAGTLALFTRSTQRLGDLLAGTIVVHEVKQKIPGDLARPEGDASMLNDSDFRARVAKVSLDEEQLLVSAALRREELSMEARLNVFAALAKRLCDDLGFQKPTHLSDEKLCLLVTAALVARKQRPTRQAPVALEK